MITTNDFKELQDVQRLRRENRSLREEVGNLKREIDANETWFHRIGRDKPKSLRFPLPVKLIRDLAQNLPPCFVLMTVEYRRVD